MFWKAAGMLTGAAVGAYTQDPLDNPFAGIIGAGIGAAAAYSMVYHNPIKPLSLKQYSFKYDKDNLSVNSRSAHELDKAQRRIGVFKSRKNKIKSLEAAILEESKKQIPDSKKIKRITDIIYKLSSKNTRFENNLKTILSSKNIAMSNTLTSETAKFVNSAYDAMLSNTTLKSISATNEIKNIQTIFTKITGDMVDTSAVELIKRHFMAIGANEDDAYRKARNIQYALNGLDFSMSNTDLSLNHGGKTYNFPLTGHTAGDTRFTKINETFYLAKGFNPFGRLAEQGSLFEHAELNQLYDKDPKKALQLRMDTEEIFGFLKDGNSTKEMLNKADSFIRQNMEYMASEAHLGTANITDIVAMTNSDFSRKAVVTSAGTIGFSHALAKDSRGGEFYFKEIENIGKLNSAGQPTRSEYSAFMSYMQSTFNYDPLEGQSVNTLGRYTTLDKNFKILENDSFFPTGERGYGTQSIRPYIDSSGQKILNRLDIDAALATKIAEFNGTLSTDDGAGIIFRKGAAKLAESQYQIFEIPRSETGDFVVGNSIEKYMGDKSLTNISKDEILGYDKNGQALKIGNVFSYGDIDNLEISGDVMKVRVKSTFKPGFEDDWVKLFSTSSKAGYSMPEIKAEYRVKQMIIEDMLNKGRFDKMKIALDTGLLIDEIDDALSGGAFGNADKIDKIMQATGLDDIDIVTAEKETGGNLLNDLYTNQNNPLAAIHGNGYEIKKIITDANISESHFNDPIFQKNLLGLDSTDELERLRSGLFFLAQTDYKGNSDILETLKYNASQQNNTNALNQLDALAANGGRAFHTDTQKAYSVLDKIIGAVIKSPSSLLIRQTKATVDLGIGLHGIGNTGSMSWIEQTQLLSSGLSRKLIDSITTANSDALYELELLRSTNKRGVVLSDVEKKANASKINNLFSLRPELREETLKSIYGDFEGFALHSLTLPDGYAGEIKSIPISAYSTNRTNIFSTEDNDILSALEKERKSLINMDIEYATQSDENIKKLIGEKYKERLAQFESSMTSLVKGDGNIAKEAAKRNMPGSTIMRARSILPEPQSGVANNLVNSSTVFVNSNTAYDLVQKAGIDTSRISIVDNGIVMIKSIDDPNKLVRFNTLVTREPAQGAYSTIIGDLAIDNKLQDNDVGIHRNLGGYFKQGMFLDFDYDILKVASAHFDEKSHAEAIENLKLRQLREFSYVSAMMSQLSAKERKATKTMHGSFENIYDYNQHQMYSGMKGRQRKFLASHATDLAMNMTNALDANLKNMPGTQDEIAQRSLRGRVLIHNISESLIKSAHRSTSDLAKNGAISEIELLKSAYSKLAKGDASTFAEDFNRSLDSLFNIDKSSQEYIDLIKPAIDDVISSTVNTAGEMESNKGRISDFRGTRTMSDLLDNLGKFAESGMVPAEEIQDAPITTKATMRTGKEIYNNIKKNIYANRKPIGAGIAGLAATAMVVGAESPEMTKETLPYKTSDDTLPPMQSENAQTYKKKEFRNSTNIKARHYENGASSSRIRRDTFGQNNNGRTNITVRDNRQNDY